MDSNFSTDGRAVATSSDDLLDFSAVDILKAVRADAQKDGKIYLVKACSKLKATYQIRMLLFQAISEDKVFVLCLNPDCLLSNPLKELQRTYKSNFELLYRG